MRSALPARAALAVAYVAFPLAMGITHLSEGLGLPRNIIDLVWAGFAVLCLASVLARGRDVLAGSLPVALAALAGLALLVRFGPALFDPLVVTAPLLMELKPFFYLAVAGTVLAAGAPPDRRDVLTCGSFLASYLILDFLASSLSAGALTRPYGSGEINYDACLVLIALALNLDKGMPTWRQILLILGVAVTFSRSGYVGLGLVLALAVRGNPLLLLGIAGLSFAGVAASFVVRELAYAGPESVDRYWMWLAGIELALSHPWQILTGFTPGRPLPVDVPAPLAELWQTQGQTWQAAGVFAFNFHSFWLRVAVTWGLWAVVALAAWWLRLLWVGPQTLRALALIVLSQGMTMGLFYLSNVAVPLCLALAAAWSPGEFEGPNFANPSGESNKPGTPFRKS
jgi:hypothetical protein